MAVQYYYSDNGANQQGPVTLDQLREARIQPTTLVWRDGLPSWAQAQTLAELAELFAPPVVQGAIETPQPMELTPPAQPHYQQQGQLPYVNYQPTDPAAQPTNGMAMASMICGIIGIVGGCLLIPSILAIIFGHIARAQIRRGEGSGDGLAVAGLWMGYIWNGLMVLVIVIYILFFVVAIGVAATAAATSPRSF